MKISLVTLAVVALLSPLAIAQESASELDTLISTTLENHPSVSSARAKLEAAEARVAQVQGWPDPILSLGASNYPVALNPLDLSRFPMTSTRMGIAQRLPKSGTIELKRQLAEAGAALAATEIDSARLELATAVKRRYVQLQYNRLMLAAVKDLNAKLEQLQQVVTGKYESGLVPLSSVLRMQNLKDDLTMRLLDLEQAYAAGIEDLYWFTGMSSEELSLEFSQSLQPPSLQPSKIIEHGIKYRPDFKSQRARIALTNTQGGLAEKELAPDVTLSASYGYRWDLTDLWTVQVAISLPLNRDHQRAKIHEQELIARTHQLMLQSMKRRLRSTVASIDAQLATLNEKQRHLDTVLIPNLRTTAASTLARFENNQISLLDYLEVEMQLIQANLTRISIDQEISQLTIDRHDQAGFLYPREEADHDNE